MAVKPANVTDEAWAAAVAKANEDPKRAARLLARGHLEKVPGVPRMRLPDPRNLAIRPKRRKR